MLCGVDWSLFWNVVLCLLCVLAYCLVSKVARRRVHLMIERDPSVDRHRLYRHVSKLLADCSSHNITGGAPYKDAMAFICLPVKSQSNKDVPSKRWGLTWSLIGTVLYLAGMLRRANVQQSQG